MIVCAAAPTVSIIGVGGRISGLLGGKMDDLHGPSLPFENVEVLSLDDEGHFVCKGPMMTGTAFYMGKTAVLSIKGTYVLYYITLYCIILCYIVLYCAATSCN